METAEVIVMDEEFGPDERYRIYERRVRFGTHEKDGVTRPAWWPHTLIATCGSAEAVGTALVQLAEDRWEAGDTSTPVVGVLDGERHRWISGLWVGGGLL